MTFVKFHLQGDTAFFKKPDVNSYIYFTYGQIHKVALLGMFGAILGYGGYSECKENSKKKGTVKLPEFYEKLRKLKLSVVPYGENGIFSKKVQKFNNTVGYASKEQGGNLIVSEQWLEFPEWDVYVRAEEEQGKALEEALLEKKSIFVPYLGKNDHFASITEVNSVEETVKIQNPDSIHSLYRKKDGILDMTLPEDADDAEEEIPYFKYEESLPVALNSESSLYELESFVFTNMKIRGFQGEAYEIQGKNIAFY